MGSEDQSGAGATDVDAVANLANTVKNQPNYPPNPTLYVSNIDWSIKKPLLKRSLHALFTRHGKVLEIVCLRGDSTKGGGKPKCLKGQAWVVFESLSAATVACQAERGFVFFGRPLKVNFAKEVSDRIAKRDGTYNAEVKERREAKRKLGATGDYGEASKMMKISSNDAPTTTSVNDPSSLLGKQPKSGNTANEIPQSKPGLQPSSTPSPLLLAQHLPPECNDMMLAILFRQYSGYKEVKMVESDSNNSVIKKDSGSMATIEFETESQATAALKALNGFKLTMSSTLDLSYGTR